MKSNLKTMIVSATLGVLSILSVESAYANFGLPGNTGLNGTCATSGSFGVNTCAIQSQGTRRYGVSLPAGLPYPGTLGRTPTQVNANFQHIIIHNMHAVGVATILTHLSSWELYRLKTMFTHSAGSTAALDALVKQYAPAALQTKYFNASAADAQTNIVPHGPGPRLHRMAWLTSNYTAHEKPFQPPSGALAYDMTIEEIYLDFRTGGVAVLSVEAGLACTAMFVGGELLLAASIGWTAGQLVNQAIAIFAPSLSKSIGSSLDTITHQVGNALDGAWYRAVDSMFGMPIADNGDLSGDYGVGTGKLTGTPSITVSDGYGVYVPVEPYNWPITDFTDQGGCTDGCIGGGGGGGVGGSFFIEIN